MEEAVSGTVGGGWVRTGRQDGSGRREQRGCCGGQSGTDIARGSAGGTAGGSGGGADPFDGARVLPVGPGPSPMRLVAVEIDPALAAELPKTIADRAPGLVERVDVLTTDALAVGEKEIGLPAPAALAANLPYTLRYRSCCACSRRCRRWSAALSWCRPRSPTGCARGRAAGCTECRRPSWPVRERAARRHGAV